MSSSAANVLFLFPEMGNSEENTSSKDFLEEYREELLKLDCDNIENYCKIYGKQAFHESAKISMSKGNIPFVPVITRYMKSVPDLISLLKDEKGVSGQTNLNPIFLRNLKNIPSLFYWIYNVNFGKNLNNRTPLGAEDAISYGNKKPLSVEEVITLCLFFPLHLKYQVVALGSNYGDRNKSLVDEIPVIGKKDGRLSLYLIKRTEGGEGFIYPTKN